MKHHPRRSSAWFAALFATAWVLCGCAATEPEFNEEGFEPNQRPIDTVIDEPDFASPTSTPVTWSSTRIAVRLSDPVEDTWALTDETVLPELTRAVWNGNGLRLGLIQLADVGKLAPTFDEIIEQRNVNIVSYDYPDVLRRSPPLGAEFFADLTIPPGPVDKQTFTRGRMVMLMSSKPRGSGANLTLTPQHYKHKASLLPRNPLEKILDGRVFDELAVTLTVNPSEAILLGFYNHNPPPEPEPESESESESGQDNVPPLDTLTTDGNPQGAASPTLTTQPQDKKPPLERQPVPEDSEEVEPPPLNIGRGAFTTGINDKDLQIFYLLRPHPN